MTAPEYLIVGRIRKPHGVRGEVIVEPITDAPDAIFASGRRLSVGDAEGELLPALPPLEIDAVRPFQDGLFIVRFEGIADRNQAEGWRERHLLVPADEVEPPGEGEAWLHELVGMRVELASGEPVGELLELFEYPQGLVADVRWKDRVVTLPLGDAFLREIDRPGRRIVLELPEGFLE